MIVTFVFNYITKAILAALVDGVVLHGLINKDPIVNKIHFPRLNSLCSGSFSPKLEYFTISNLHYEDCLVIIKINLLNCY